MLQVAIAALLLQLCGAAGEFFVVFATEPQQRQRRTSQPGVKRLLASQRPGHETGMRVLARGGLCGAVLPGGGKSGGCKHRLREPLLPKLGGIVLTELKPATISGAAAATFPQREQARMGGNQRRCVPKGGLLP